MNTLFDRADFLGERFDVETISVDEQGVIIELTMVIPGNVLQVGNNETVMYLANELQKISGKGVSTTYNGVDLKKGTARVKMIVPTTKMLHVEQSEIKPKKKYVKKSLDVATKSPPRGDQPTICSVEGCGHPVKHKGFCSHHYYQDYERRRAERASQ